MSNKTEASDSALLVKESSCIPGGGLGVQSHQNAAPNKSQIETSMRQISIELPLPAYASLLKRATMERTSVECLLSQAINHLFSTGQHAPSD